MRYLKVMVQEQLSILLNKAIPCFLFILPGAPVLVQAGSERAGAVHETRKLIACHPQSVADGIELTVQNDQFPLLCQIIVFQASYVNQMAEAIQPSVQLFLREESTSYDTNIRNLLKQMETEQRFAAPGFDWMTRNIAAQLAILIVRHLEVDDEHHHSLPIQRGLHQKMPELLDYLRSHCVKPSSLQVIAERLGVNPSHLSRSFRQTYQMTIRDYLISCRLDLACQLLKNDSLLISDIAKRCGYKTASRFSAMFLKRTGLRPIEYRRVCLSTASDPAQLDRSGQLLYDHINIQEYYE